MTHLLEDLIRGDAELGGDGGEGRAVIHHRPHLFVVVTRHQVQVAAGIQRAKLREEPAAIISRKLRIQRVYRDVDGTAVSLKLENIL